MMLRQVLLVAALSTGIHGVKVQLAQLLPEDLTGGQTPALSVHEDKTLAEIAAELQRAAEDRPDLAEAAAGFATELNDEAFARLQTSMASVSSDEHALQTLWRALDRIYTAGDSHDDLYESDSVLN